MVKSEQSLFLKVPEGLALPSARRGRKNEVDRLVPRVEKRLILKLTTAGGLALSIDC
jgi:hypothetical protein